MNGPSANKNQVLASWVFGSILLTVLVAVVFVKPVLTDDQRPILKLFMSLTGGLFAFFLSGTVTIHGKALGLVWRASGGLAVFVIMQFFVDPFESKRHTADRIADMYREFVACADAQICQAQYSLILLGYYTGKVDGKKSPEFITAFQQARKIFSIDPNAGFDDQVAQWVSSLPRSAPQLQAIAWMRFSAEYVATSRLAYDGLVRSVARALSAAKQMRSRPSEGGDLPLAVVCDVDDTVISSIDFESQLVLDGRAFDQKAWVDFVRTSPPRAVPGSVEALSRIANLGVTVIFQSRRAGLREETLQQLRALLLPVASDGSNLLDREVGGSPWSAKKVHDEIRRKYNIVAIVGDSIADFGLDPKLDSASARLNAANSTHWGDDWFLVPNPAYGDWERALQSPTPGKIHDSEDAQELLLELLRKSS